MKDYSDISQIRITDRYAAFGYGLPDNYESYYITVDGRIKPSEITNIMEEIIHSGETGISDWYNTEEIYRRGYAGASGGSFDFVLSVSSGIAANFITEIVKRLIKNIVLKDNNYSSEDALKDCYSYLSQNCEITKSNILLKEQRTDKDFYYFIFKHKLLRKYYSVKLSKRHEVDNYRVCNSYKEVKYLLTAQHVAAGDLAKAP
jgi:predicted small secreted protein